MAAVMAYASRIHDIDLDGWTRNLDSSVEAYGKTVELGDREYALEIRLLSDTKSDWLIQQGDYDGQRGRFDSYIANGVGRTLKDAYDSVLDACAKFEPPAPHII